MYRKRIEKISKNFYAQEEEEIEETSACPFCGNNVPEFEFDCKECHNVIPFCVSSGK